MPKDIPIEKRFAALVEICRASHFAWREAAVRCCPDVDERTLVNEMWDITGVQTAEAYLKRLDPSGNLPGQIAASIVWSSQCMGEDAHVEEGKDPSECFVKHEDCPWHRWHQKLGLLAEDRPGCDRWFDAAIRTINEKLGTNIRFETLSSLPDGCDCCLRRIWEEKPPTTEP
ncbi:MAG: L-2-amino-thiazoline-4-carboxylic acid hydrolase [Planctomycetota bacterium]